jgi:hypothetical protein
MFLWVLVAAFAVMAGVANAQCVIEEVITPMFAERYQATLEAKFEGVDAQVFIGSLIKNGHGEEHAMDASIVTVLVYTSPRYQTNKLFYMGADGCVIGHGTLFKEDYAKVLEGMKSVAAPSSYQQGCKARPMSCA